MKSPLNGSILISWPGASSNISVLSCAPSISVPPSQRAHPGSHPLSQDRLSKRPLTPPDRVGRFPTGFFPVREKRYLYQRNETGQKHIIPDRYEFLVYRLVRHRLEAGDLFCRDSVHFRSFEDDLVDDQQWANKEVLLAQTGVALLAQPIGDHLAELKCQLEERISTVNQRISAGENSHFHLTTTGKRKSWTLQYPTNTEPINHPIFETLPQVNISSVLHFVNHHCHFMTCFEHVLGRYSKQAANERCLTPVSLPGQPTWVWDVWVTFRISPSPHWSAPWKLSAPETLKAANDCISNAIAALTIFRHYDIANVLHSSSDGQKFETALPTFNARYSRNILVSTRE